MRRSSLVLAAAVVLGLCAPSHAATGVDSTGNVYSTDKVVVPLVFPVVGPTSFTETFLACRSGCTRKHMGEDLMGPKMSPLVAACDGTVVSQKRETTVGGGNYLVIACDRGAAAGWSVVYIHINNDTPGTDDGRGTAAYAFPAGIAPGVRVMAGQLVAWRGDSGDAESTGPHLHFELRRGNGWGGVVYSAFASLTAARHLPAPTQSGPHPDGTLILTPQNKVFQITRGLHKALVTPGVMAANRLQASNAIRVGAGETALYQQGAPLAPRSGALVRDTAGQVWRVNGGTRYAVTPRDTDYVAAVADADLAPLAVVDDPQTYTPGMLLNTVTGRYVVGSDGLLHSVYTTLMVSYGWRQTDLVDVPADTELPGIGAPLGLRDGTLAQVAGLGTVVMSDGVMRRLWDAREVAAYGYAGKVRLPLLASMVAGLASSEVAGDAPQQYGYHH